jgi:hypothetical protein
MPAIFSIECYRHLEIFITFIGLSNYNTSISCILDYTQLDFDSNFVKKDKMNKQLKIAKGIFVAVMTAAVALSLYISINCGIMCYYSGVTDDDTQIGSIKTPKAQLGEEDTDADMYLGLVSGNVKPLTVGDAIHYTEVLCKHKSVNFACLFTKSDTASNIRDGYESVLAAAVTGEAKILARTKMLNSRYRLR